MQGDLKSLDYEFKLHSHQVVSFGKNKLLSLNCFNF